MSGARTLLIRLNLAHGGAGACATQRWTRAMRPVQRRACEVGLRHSSVRYLGPEILRRTNPLVPSVVDWVRHLPRERDTYTHTRAGLYDGPANIDFRFAWESYGCILQRPTSPGAHLCPKIANSVLKMTSLVLERFQ